MNVCEKKNVEIYYETWLSFLLQQMVNPNMVVSNENVIGKNAKKAYSVLRKFAIEYCGVDVLFVDFGEGLLGLFDEEECCIELNRRQTFNERVLTLAHEIGHYLTHSGFRPDINREILAEFFSYLVVFFLGLKVSGYYYLQKMGHKQAYLRKKAHYLKKVFSEFTSWYFENYGEQK
jgi:hypothetical protein